MDDRRAHAIVAVGRCGAVGADRASAARPTYAGRVSAASTPIEPGSAQPEGVGDAGPTRFTFGRNQRLTLDREYQRVRREGPPEPGSDHCLCQSESGRCDTAWAVGGQAAGRGCRPQQVQAADARGIQARTTPPPAGYDLVVTCRPPPLRPLATPRRWLRELAKALPTAWRPPLPPSPTLARTPPLSKSHPSQKTSRKPPPSQGES